MDDNPYQAPQSEKRSYKPGFKSGCAVGCLSGFFIGAASVVTSIIGVGYYFVEIAAPVDPVIFEAPPIGPENFSIEPVEVPSVKPIDIKDMFDI